MRAAVVWLVVACSHPPKHNGGTPPTPPSDAAVEIDAEAADATSVDAALAEKDFDWGKIRKRVEDAQAARKGQPRPRPCGADNPKEECSPRVIRLAARGRLMSAWPPQQKLSTLLLDLGSDDGVSEYHWAAVLDDADRPITKYARVETIRRGECVVRLELTNFIGTSFGSGARVALVGDPPAGARAPD